MSPFKAFVIDQDGNEMRMAGMTTPTAGQAGAGEATIRVHYSSINHRGALAVLQAGRIIRRCSCAGGIGPTAATLASGCGASTGAFDDFIHGRVKGRMVVRVGA